jgi:hypothetical protein
LLEITYDTGAKVILQGPVTYEVESAAGGYLAIGRLTAKLEKGPRSKVQGPGSELRTGLFAVRTPAAIVTDLGTEFGVEVDAHGNSHVETLVGLVQALPIVNGKPREGRNVAAGEAVQINRRGEMTTTTQKPNHFARNAQKEPSPYVTAVLADRPLTYWRLNDAPRSTWVLDSTGHGYHGRVCGAPVFAQRGPLADSDSRAIQFGFNDYIELQNTPNVSFAKGFTIEAWARCLGRVTVGSNDALVLLAWRDEMPFRQLMGFTLYVSPENTWAMQIGTGLAHTNWGDAELKGPTPVLNEWGHLVCVFQPTVAKDEKSPNGIARLYINNRLVAEGARRFAPNQRQPLRIGAGATELATPAYFFIGDLAEVAIYDQPLDAKRVDFHWKASGFSGVTK